MKDSVQCHRSLVLLAAVWVAVLACVCRSQTCNGLQDLGTLGGSNSSALGISTDGSVVVGYAYTAQSYEHAFRWTASGGMQDLGTLGGAVSVAYGISADGSIVVGHSSTAGNFENRAFRWTASGGIQDLGTLGGGSNSWAFDISANGSSVVGRASISGDAGTHAFRWTAAGGMQDLGTLGGWESQAFGISADGIVVVGDAWLAGNAGYHAFRWTGKDGMQDLGTLGGLISSASDISADGSVVVGHSSATGNGGYHAFRWTATGGMLDLGTLGGPESAALGISADGTVVVGAASTAGNGGYHAFRWTAAGGMKDLGTLGGSASYARGVSDDGSTVVGFSYLAEDAGFHAVRWEGVIHRIDPRDADNEAAHRTDGYALTSMPGNDQERTILRRGARPEEPGTATFDVVLCEGFDPSKLTLCFEREDTFDGAAHAAEIPFFHNSVPQGQWGCTLVKLGDPQSGERTATMRVFIPATAPIGQYTFRAVVKDNAHPDLQLEQKAFEHPVVVLFNPADPDDQVYIPGQAAFDEYVMNTSGLIWRGTASERAPHAWSYSQFDESVFLATLDLLSIPVSGVTINSAGRSNPTIVAAFLTNLMRSDSNGVLLESRWCPSCDATKHTPEECLAAALACCEAGEFPWSWNDSREAYAWFRAYGTPFKYGQCWNYSGVLTSALRTLGIPVRPLTNFESAHDDSWSDGVLVRCRRWNSEKEVWYDLWSDGVWTFHSWCEAWIGNQWRVADATYGLGPIPVADIKATHADLPGAGFVIAEVDDNYLVSYFNEDTQTCDPLVDNYYFSTRIGRHITTKAAGNSMAEDITCTYKTPETTDDPREYSEVVVTTEPGIPMGEPVGGVVEVKNSGAAARDYLCNVQVVMVAQDGAVIGAVYGPLSEPLTVGSGQTGAVLFSVPWEQIRPWTRFTDTVRVEVAVTAVGQSGVAFRERLVRIRGIPVQIAMDPAEILPPGEQALATIHFSNPLTTPLTNARLKLTSDAGLPINGTITSETIPLGSLAPGMSGSVQRTLAGLTEGPHGLVATLLADDAVPGDDLEPIRVGLCPSDFDKSGFVDTDDFTAFVLAFEAGGNDADVDGSGFVDTDDFTFFVVRFEAGC